MGRRPTRESKYYKNSFCKHYNSCLDKHAHKNTRFDCSECEFKDNREGRPSFTDISSYKEEGFVLHSLPSIKNN